MDARAAVRRLVAEQPSFHAVDGEPRVWNALPGTLELLAGLVAADQRTLETGCGASTVVFAAAGAQHLAISPHAAEHERVRAWCEQAGIATDGLRFAAASSDDVLPTLEPAPALDLAFVDGRHAFPHPVVDFHYVDRLLRVGGTLVLDDAPIPAVAVVVRHLLGDEGWELLDVADDRAAAFRKVAEAPLGDPWRSQPFNRRFPDLTLVPRWRRPAVRAGELARRAARAVRGR